MLPFGPLRSAGKSQWPPERSDVLTLLRASVIAEQPASRTSWQAAASQILTFTNAYAGPEQQTRNRSAGGLCVRPHRTLSQRGHPRSNFLAPCSQVDFGFQSLVLPGSSNSPKHGNLLASCCPSLITVAASAASLAASWVVVVLQLRQLDFRASLFYRCLMCMSATYMLFGDAPTDLAGGLQQASRRSG